MPRYIATINVPGYLPMDDDPPIFDTPREAWEWLADARREAEDSVDTCSDPKHETPCPADCPECQDGCGYSATVNTLESLGDGTLSFAEVGEGDGTGSDTGDTPGYDGDHDLGLAYTVSIADPFYDDSPGSAAVGMSTPAPLAETAEEE